MAGLDGGPGEKGLFVGIQLSHVFEEHFAEAGAFVQIDAGNFKPEPLGSRIAH